MTLNQMKDCIREKLTDKRYAHSIEVAKEAVRLAKIYKADPYKAEVAGLLHDIMKDTPNNDLYDYMEYRGVKLNPVEKNAPKLWHAIAGALYIEHDLGLKDDEILNAVRYHTTARADMSLLEKVLYLADFTSLDRDYDGVEQLRLSVSKDMETAMMEALRFTISDLCQNGNPIHENTVKAYNQLICEK